jgi:hypothetical protein
MPEEINKISPNKTGPNKMIDLFMLGSSRRVFRIVWRFVSGNIKRSCSQFKAKMGQTGDEPQVLIRKNR